MKMKTKPKVRCQAFKAKLGTIIHKSSKDYNKKDKSYLKILEEK